MPIRSRLTAPAAAVAVLALAACSHPAAPSPTASAPTSSASRSASHSGSPSAQGSATSTDPKHYNGDISDCTTGVIENPDTFAVPARNITEPMLAVGLDAKGNVGAPPLDQMMTMAWWNGGPKVGSDQGHVVLTAHTGYGLVGLGNVMADPDSGLKPDDVMKVTGDGKTVCYAYTNMVVIDAATYDPSSTVWINPNGDPKLTIMICWDYHPSTGEWGQRHVFFADPIRK